MLIGLSLATQNDPREESPGRYASTPFHETENGGDGPRRYENEAQDQVGPAHEAGERQNTECGQYAAEEPEPGVGKLDLLSRSTTRWTPSRLLDASPRRLLQWGAPSDGIAASAGVSRANEGGLVEMISTRPFSVDLVYLCSTNSITGVTTADLRRISASVGDFPAKLEPSTRRSWKRLGDAERAAVVARYEAGEISTALATEYGVAKSTILGILRASGVVVRRQPLTTEQVSEAAQLYESGLSLSQVAMQLGVNQETMRVAIVKAGVTLRDPTRAKII